MKHIFMIEVNDDCGIEDENIAKSLVDAVLRTGCLNLLPRTEQESLKFQERFTGCKKINFNLEHISSEGVLND